MALRRGILLLGQHPPDRLSRIARLAEDLGYTDLWYADERFYREVYVGLTFCALNTSSISLGPCVTDPYSRHPALTAMAIASLDEVSGGRAVLGLGAGVSGFRELGVAREAPAVAMREAVEVIRGLLRGETVDYQGRVIRVLGARLGFQPIRPNVPIYVASDGPRGLETAGRVADGAIMEACVSDEALQYLRHHVGRGARKAGRAVGDLDLVSRVNVCIHKDLAVARDVLRPSVASGLIGQQPDFLGFTAAGLTVPPSLLDKVRRFSYGQESSGVALLAPEIPDAFVDAMALAGPAERVAENLTRMAAQGISHVIIRPKAPDGNIERVIEAFAMEVLPRAETA